MNDVISPLLVSKIRPLPARAHCIPRKHVMLPLWADPALRLMLLTAPAGYGKTTLLVEWAGELRQAGAAVAWYALDAGDDDPARFSAYLLAALAEALGTPAEVGEALLETLGPGACLLPAERSVASECRLLAT